MEALPHELMRAYSFQDNPVEGCLDKQEESRFKVVVDLQVVPTRNDTHIEVCQSQYSEYPYPDFP